MSGSPESTAKFEDLRAAIAQTFRPLPGSTRAKRNDPQAHATSFPTIWPPSRDIIGDVNFSATMQAKFELCQFSFDCE
jgi:hypothetical protein